MLLPYIALTRESAKNIMWPILSEVNDRYGMGAIPKEASLSYVLPNGARIALFGADQKNFIKRLRGIKTPFAAIDEAQGFGTHLSELIDDILTPAISDFDDGQIAVTGTPGTVPRGMFYEITELKQHGYSHHFWTVYDNPFMPNAKEFVQMLMQKKAWTPDNPTLLREWYGRWVKDIDALIYKYSRARNWVSELPKNKGEWFYVMGVDLGYFPDPSAFVVMAYQRHDPTLYILEVHKQLEMTVSDVADQIKVYAKKYPNMKVVIDQGGGGRQSVEEMRKRHGLSLVAAEKAEKANFIDLMNSDLMGGRIKLVGSACDPLIEEWESLQWDAASATRKENPSQPNHCTDGALYGWRWAYNYAWTPDVKPPAPDSEEAVDEWWEKESENAKNAENKPFWERL